MSDNNSTPPSDFDRILCRLADEISEEAERLTALLDRMIEVLEAQPEKPRGPLCPPIFIRWIKK